MKQNNFSGFPPVAPLTDEEKAEIAAIEAAPLEFPEGYNPEAPFVPCPENVNGFAMLESVHNDPKVKGTLEARRAAEQVVFGVRCGIESKWKVKAGAYALPGTAEIEKPVIFPECNEEWYNSKAADYVRKPIAGLAKGK